jgi:hypothetical protein
MPPDTGLAAPAALPPGDADASSLVRHVVTGNRLRDGIPVYFAGGGRWSPTIHEAVHVAAAAAEALLVEAQGDAAPHPVVGHYLIEAATANGRLRPQSLRERIRAFGPTVGYARR